MAALLMSKNAWNQAKAHTSPPKQVCALLRPPVA